jgi:tape measure domain-containing protein
LENDTVVIDIAAKYKDETSSGLSKTKNNADKLSDSILKAQKQADKLGKTKANATLGVIDRATAAINKVETSMKRMAGKTFSMTMKVVDYATAPLRSIYNFATSVRGVITGLIAGAATKKAIIDPIGLSDQFTTAQVGFETKLKSVAAAQKMMKDIQEFAIRTPFETEDVVNTSQQMLAMGWQAKRILPDLEKIGNAAAATGKGSEGIERITLALNQMRMKGKVSADEMLQLTDAGVSGWQYLAKGLGKSTAEVQKMAEKGLIPAEKAIDLIVKGMGEFDGMMDKTANRTVSGLISQIKDLFTISIVKNWGDGLQSGAIKGLTEINDWLNTNRSSFDKFGATLKTWGTQFSTWVVDSTKSELNTVKDMINDPAFQKADFWGKTEIAWDKLIAEPAAKWWNGSGGQKLRQIADKAGQAIGESIAKGIGIAVNKAIPAIASDAATLLPGGSSPSGTSLLSTAALLWGGSKVAGLAGGAVKGVKGIAGLFGAGSSAAEASSAAATGGLAISGTALAGLLGAAGAAGGVAAAGNDFSYALTQETQKGRTDANTKGITRMGMVGAGAGLGAAIGSIFPGLGTLVGGLAGAGIGGVAAMLEGGKLGQWISDWHDGTLEINKTSEALSDATKNYDKFASKDKSVQAIIEDYKHFSTVMIDNTKTNEEHQKAYENMKADVKALADIYPDLITQYDIENSQLGNKLDTIKQISALEKEENRIKLEQSAANAQKSAPDISKKLQDNKDELSNLKYKEKKYSDSIQTLTKYKAEIQKLTDEEQNLWASGDHSKDDSFNEKFNTYLEKINSITKSLDGQKFGDIYGFYNEGGLDSYTQKLTDIQNSELAALKNNASLQDKYNEIFIAQKKLIELNLGGTIEDQAAKFNKLDANAQTALLDAIEKVKKLQASLGDLPDNVKINFDLLYSEIVLGSKSGSGYTDADRAYASEIKSNAGKSSSTSASNGAKSSTSYVSDSDRAWAAEQATQKGKKKGYASGTKSASRGQHIVGENGPEIVEFNGGETVRNANETSKILSGNGGVSVQLGGSSPLFNINVFGGEDSNTVVSALQAKLPQIANILANYFAEQMGQRFGNMTASGEG